MATTNRDKFRELVVYIAAESKDDPGFGAVKLNKILYYADFAAYRELKRSISGDDYQNLEEGPAPKHLLGVRNSLIDDKSVRLISRDYFGRKQQRLVADRQPAVALLAKEERSIVDKVIRDLWGLDGSQVAARSHKEFGWQVTERKQTIPYRTAWISSEPLTPKQIEYGRDVARRYGFIAR